MGYFEVTFRDKNDKQRSCLMEIDDNAIELHEIVFPTSDDIETVKEDGFVEMDWILQPIESAISQIIVDGFGARIIIERTNQIKVRGFTSEGQ